MNTELILDSKVLDNPLNVTYYDSSNNKFIQVADVFSNIFYSNCFNNSYNEQFKSLEEQGYLKEIFKFPIKNK